MDSRITQSVVAAAKAAMRKYRVPASITIAQWALESGYGAHLPPGSNNPFGIKARSGEPYVSSMTWEHLGGRDIRMEQRFRKYASIAQAFEAHAKLLATSHYYVHAMEHVDNPNEFAKSLTGVYANDPRYDKKLIKIMKDSDLYSLDS